MRVKKNHFQVVLAAAVLLAAGRLTADDTDTGLLPLSQGTNSLAGGTSLTLFDPGVEGGLMNPANLGLLERFGFNTSFTQLFLKSNVSSFGAATPVKELGSFGAAIYRLGTPDMERRDETGRVTGSFTNEETVMRVAYGKLFTKKFPGLTVGAAADYYMRSLAGETSNLAAVTVAGRYPAMKNLDVTLVANNLVWSALGGTSDELATLYRLGAAYAMVGGMFSLSGDTTLNEGMKYSIALGYFPMKMVSFRAGTQGGTVSGGFRVNMKDYQFSYDAGFHQLNLVHHLSLSMYFGQPQKGGISRHISYLYNLADKHVRQGFYDLALEDLGRSARFRPLPADKKPIYDRLKQLVDERVIRITAKTQKDQMLRRSVDLFIDNKKDTALDTLRLLQLDYPKDETIKRLMAVMSGEGDQPKQQKAPMTVVAAPAQPKFADIDPVKLKMVKAEQYFQEQQWDLGLKELRDVIEINPKETMAYVRMGSMYYVLGMKAEASKAWNFAIRLAPNDPEVKRTIAFMKKEGLK